MPIVFGITPERATIHWNDLLSKWTLTISWQQSDPTGVYRRQEKSLTFADLAVLLNVIKTIWAIVSSDTDENEIYVFAPIGDLSLVDNVPEGFALRTHVGADVPITGSADLSGPDDMPDYDGESDDWGATPPS